MVDQTPNFEIRYPESTDNVELWTHMQTIASDTDDALKVVDDRSFPGGGGIAGTLTSNEQTTSTSYANMGAPSSFSFVKRSSATSILVTMHLTNQSTATSTTMEAGVSINGTDYTLVHLDHAQTNIRTPTSGGSKIAAGLAAGTYTIQARWRRTGGSGSVQRFGTDDFLSITAIEVM